VRKPASRQCHAVASTASPVGSFLRRCASLPGGYGLERLRSSPRPARSAPGQRLDTATRCDGRWPRSCQLPLVRRRRYCPVGSPPNLGPRCASQRRLQAGRCTRSQAGCVCQSKGWTTMPSRRTAEPATLAGPPGQPHAGRRVCHGCWPRREVNRACDSVPCRHRAATGQQRAATVVAATLTAREYWGTVRASAPESSFWPCLRLSATTNGSRQGSRP
jgi:hypothetical protein